MPLRWKSVELPKETAGRFREFCRDNHVTYETSEAGCLIHFEVLVSSEMEATANKFLSERC